MAPNRIPRLTANSVEATQSWLSRMHKHGLLFCLDDDPRDIVCIDNGMPTFTSKECSSVSAIRDRMFAALGDKVHDLAFDVVSRTFHTREERRAFKAQYG